MTDLISKDKALRCLKESSEQIDWGQSRNGDAFKHYVGATYRTIAEFKPEQPQWISVKDRLPQSFEKVLIYHKSGISYGWHNGHYWERGANTNHRPMTTVTHWMPLPEPPEEEN